tara:strand:+ start:13002 stop:14087 length:1086 start_codon:yes stop_codon:yes gene_type:complete
MINPILEKDLKNINDNLHNRDLLKNSTILITGCAGFLGYYFMNYFLKYSKELEIKKVIGLDTFLLDKANWLRELVKLFPKTLILRSFDISKDDISKIQDINNVNYVIHAASVASPSFYRKFPLETIDANIWGLRNLLDFFNLKKNHLKGFLFFSSSEIYGDPDSNDIPTNEEYRGLVSCHGPRSCYDESKRFGETICWIYGEKYNMPITVVRPFNNFGPGMRINDKRLPADFAACVLEKRDIVILSDGSPTRTFCYISDAITGYLLALLHHKYDYFNIGTEKPEISVKNFALLFKEVAQEILNYEGEVIYSESKDLNYMTDNPNRRSPKITKAKKILGYSPIVNLKEGIKRYLEFLKINTL